MGLQTVANQFLTMETLEHGVANSCKSVSKIWNRWSMGLQTVANQFLNMEPLEHGLQTVANQFLTMEPLEHGVANSCKSVSKYENVGIWGCKLLQISF